MHLTSITLTHFRNYKKKEFHFSPELSIIIGPNAVGKTNLLEAIFLLSRGKSFRADSDREMIYWGEEIARVTGEITQSTNEKKRLEVVLTTGLVSGQKTPFKKYAINGVGKRMLDFVGNLAVVLFWPEDLELVTHSPSYRRKYIDFVLISTDREYRRTLGSYEKGLRQRNRLLELIREGEAHKHQLIFWDQLLIRDGEYITKKREEYINYVNNFQIPHKNSMSEFSGQAISIRQLAEQFPKYRLEYDQSIISRMRLDQYKNAEIAAGMTLVGPHRDDFKFKIQNSKFKIQELEDLSDYGSRGEQRLAIMWLKLAELSYIESVIGGKPVLILDDIFSELDHEHRKIIFEIIGNQQTIMTTTDKHFIDNNNLKFLKIIELT